MGGEGGGELCKYFVTRSMFKKMYFAAKCAMCSCSL